MTHTFNLTNCSGYTDSFTLEVTGSSWTSTPSPTNTGELGVNRSAQVEVGVEIPISTLQAVLDSDAFTLTAASDHDPASSASVTGTTRSEVVPGVELSADTTEVGLPGTTVTHTFAVTNTGDYTDAFTVTVADHAWPATPSITLTEDLAPGGWLTAAVTVGVPGEVVSGDTDTAVLAATSRLDPDVHDSALLTTTAVSAGYRVYLPLVTRPQEGFEGN